MNTESPKVTLDVAHRIVAMIVEQGMSNIEASVAMSMANSLLALQNLPSQSEREWDAAL